MGPIEREQVAQFLALARNIIDRVGDAAGADVTVSLRCGATRLTITSPTATDAALSATSGGETILDLLRRCFLAEDERRIVLAIGTGSMTAPALQERLGLAETRLKTILALLHNRRALRLTESGYEVSDRRLLDVARV